MPTSLAAYLFWAAALRPKQAVREAATLCPRPCKLTFDLLTLKVVSESRVTWATSVPILVFLDCSRLRPDVRDRQTDVGRASSLNAPLWGRGHNK